MKSNVLLQRKRAIEALGAIGADAKDALPELKALAEKDPRPDIRRLATDAVEAITGTDTACDTARVSARS